MSEGKFQSFPARSSLPLMLSSIELILHIFNIALTSTRVDLQMLQSEFFSFPAIAQLVRVGGCRGYLVGGCRVYVAGGQLEESRLRLTQPSLAGTGLSLAKCENFICLEICD